MTQANTSAKTSLENNTKSKYSRWKSINKFYRRNSWDYSGWRKESKKKCDLKYLHFIFLN